MNAKRVEYHIDQSKTTRLIQGKYFVTIFLFTLLTVLISLRQLDTKTCEHYSLVNYKYYHCYILCFDLFFGGGGIMLFFLNNFDR